VGKIFRKGLRRDWVLERIDEIERRYKLIPKARRSRTMTLRYALEMLDCLLFDLYIRRDSTPHPLLQLAFALKDKVDGVPSLLLDGEARYEERQPYSKEAYHRLQGEAASIVEGGSFSIPNFSQSLQKST